MTARRQGRPCRRFFRLPLRKLPQGVAPFWIKGGGPKGRGDRIRSLSHGLRRASSLYPKGARRAATKRPPPYLSYYPLAVPEKRFGLPLFLAFFDRGESSSQAPYRLAPPQAAGLARSAARRLPPRIASLDSWRSLFWPPSSATGSGGAAFSNLPKSSHLFGQKILDAGAALAVYYKRQIAAARRGNAHICRIIQ